jgi:hypothetical protein
MGMMHLQDQQGGAVLDSLKKAGYFDDQPGQPGSAALPSALYNAAQKGPLGTKAAMSGVMMNFLNMNYQMKRQMQMYGAQHGGWVNPQGGGGGGGGNGGGGGGQGSGQGFDLKNLPGAISLPSSSSGSEDNAEE